MAQIPKTAVFIAGITQASQSSTLNLGDTPRVVLAGRSNVGKSSLLNALTTTRIARVSQDPGRTREINFFLWHQLILVDLPGYGFAKVSKSLREQWGKEIPKFILSEPQIRLVVSLVDGRHGFSVLDQELLKFLQTEKVPYVIAFTKMDKYKSANQRRQGERELIKQAESLGVDRYVFTSGQEAGGITSLKKVILQSTSS